MDQPKIGAKDTYRREIGHARSNDKFCARMRLTNHMTANTRRVEHVQSYLILFHHTAMANMITLQCRIQGDDPSRVFPVEVEPTKTVGTLKKTIKDEKRPEFDHIAADKLDLWTVAILLDGSLNKHLKNLELDEGGALLGWEELSEHFPGGPAKKCLHVVMRPPAGKLAAP
jgi:hypothetical protein